LQVRKSHVHKFWPFNIKTSSGTAKFGKQARIGDFLAEFYPANQYPEGVPSPGKAPRKELKARILERDKSLAPLDEATLMKAIDAFNKHPRASQ
jgi:hypothetical protein